MYLTYVRDMPSVICFYRMTQHSTKLFGDIVPLLPSTVTKHYNLQQTHTLKFNDRLSSLSLRSVCLIWKWFIVSPGVVLAVMVFLKELSSGGNYSTKGDQCWTQLPHSQHLKAVGPWHLHAGGTGTKVVKTTTILGNYVLVLNVYLHILFVHTCKLTYKL